jgi:DNA invertase Pin-like site-specific DNA recombinase
MSGSNLDRVNLQRLRRDARRRDFEAILVEDLSRLSRDLGDVWNLVFNEFAFLGVRVLDCTSGTDSDNPSARMVFGAMGLIADGFLQMVRAETHRGLEGRALAGFHTGGKTYGFGATLEPNPPIPEKPRKLRIILPEEAKVVRRIFDLFDSGLGPKSIAAQLNEDGVPAPHDGGKGHKRNRGWGHTTIRHMLRNENYIGVWIWNRNKFQQIPGTRSYRHVPRPEKEHVRKEIPELRIIPQDLWERVQAKIKKRKLDGGSPAGSTKDRRGSILSGLMRCGACGGSFGVISRVTKDGASYTNFGCLANRSRGDAICANVRTVSERKLTQAVLSVLQDRLLTAVPPCVDRSVLI